MTNTTNFNSLMKQSWSGVAVLSIFYIVIVIGLSLMSPWFFSFNNAMNIGINMSYIGLMAAQVNELRCDGYGCLINEFRCDGYECLIKELRCDGYGCLIKEFRCDGYGSFW